MANSETMTEATPPVSARARGIDRAIDLLECLHAAREPLRIGEIARRLNAPRSTTYEIINRLVEAGILENYDGDGSIFFGKSVHFYAADYLGKHGLTKKGRDEVRRLAKLTDETTEFCMLHQDKYTVVHMQTGARMFRISSEIGVKVPIPWTASGRLLVDHLSPAEILDFIPAEDFILPDGRAVETDQFLAEVAQARRSGLYVTSGLVDSFTHCMAAPIRDSQGVAVATICFVLPADTPAEDRTRLLDMLVLSGKQLSRSIAG